MAAAAPDISSDFPYGPNYVEVRGSKIHYIDEGSGDPVLFIHGNPTYSYLWRNIIPYVAPAARCIAMDLIGMGKSDKPDIEYWFSEHLEYVEGFIEKMGLKNLTLVIHDWGSAIGFHYASRHENNVKAIAFMESIVLPSPTPSELAGQLPHWQAMEEAMKLQPDVDALRQFLGDQNAFIEQVLPGAVVRGLTEEEMNHYREPFRDPPSRKPIWRWFSQLAFRGIPSPTLEVVEAYNRWLRDTDLPMLLLYCRPGAAIPEPHVKWCQKHLKNLKSVDIGPGIHYLQEDNPHLIGSELANWYGSL